MREGDKICLLFIFYFVFFQKNLPQRGIIEACKQIFSKREREREREREEDKKRENEKQFVRKEG